MNTKNMGIGESFYCFSYSVSYYLLIIYSPSTFCRLPDYSFYPPFIYIYIDFYFSTFYRELFRLPHFSGLLQNYCLTSLNWLIFSRHFKFPFFTFRAHDSIWKMVTFYLFKSLCLGSILEMFLQNVIVSFVGLWYLSKIFFWVWFECIFKI